MKNLKKINLGLLLTIITLLAVTIYSINIEAQRKSSKDEIKKTCEEYIDVVDKYLVLPEDAQVLGEDVKNVNLDSFKADMEKELKEKMISDSAVKIQKEILTDYAENDLLNTEVITTSFDRKITKIKSYSFEGDQVTVSFDAKITIKQKYYEVNPENGEKQEKVREESRDAKSDMITLEKKDGKWKVVYSNFDYALSSYSNPM